ncbi:MAG: ABC transporter permease subunit [Victivallales bacterium]|nr:ABC transporter permease subunit [Victivallales bacterium]
MVSSWFRLNPVTAKRLKRFRSFRRAWISFWILLVLYVVSLCAELVCNNRPLLLRHRGRFYFPAFRYYPADEFLHDGSKLAANYRELADNAEFMAESWMLWPMFRSSPNEQVQSSELEKYRRVNVYLSRVPGVGSAVIVDTDMTLGGFEGGETLVASPDNGFAGHRLTEFWKIPSEIIEGIHRRFKNEDMPQAEVSCQSTDGKQRVQMKLLPYKKRRQPPRRVTMKISDDGNDLNLKLMMVRFERGSQTPALGKRLWEKLPGDVRASIIDEIQREFHDSGENEADRRTYGDSAATTENASSKRLRWDGHEYELHCELERVEHPFRPVPHHWMGLDDAGRDVLARVLYGLRTSLTFGLVLVISSMFFGTMMGCLQGYFGGLVDLLGQRAIEIWSALPFLYIVILMGSLFGAGFWLLIACYALFNWIGVSYYMRAEMLRLRKQPFVEAAQCLGLPWWIVVLRHILPNALVPLVTFVPFSLVGAIGALAGLDYLGFGLPPPTPSLGQLLQQAQVQREAWWLIVYPSAALFIVMLLCVFIGEGVREAFDPRRQNRIH